MKKVVSEDAVRRAFKAIGETQGAVWLRGHLAFCVAPLLAEPWILPASRLSDATIARKSQVKGGPASGSKCGSSVYSTKLAIVFLSCAPLTSRLRQMKGCAFSCQASVKS